ncbi:hypothetical protein PMAYCL1PPCAC_25837, partial [Pristionchus mayeri]
KSLNIDAEYDEFRLLFQYNTHDSDGNPKKCCAFIFKSGFNGLFTMPQSQLSRNSSLQFGQRPIFGHLVGPSSHGKCALYTISDRSCGNIPELLRIEARLSSARDKKCLVRESALFQ